MATNDDLRSVRVEVETIENLDPTETAPVVAANQSAGRGPMLVVVIVLGGLLAALVWLNSGADAAAVDEPSAEEVAEIEERDPPETADDVDDVASQPGAEITIVAIPDSSSASLDVQPTDLAAFPNPILFNGEILSHNDSQALRSTPPVLVSADGELLRDLETSVLVDGSQNSVDYFWSAVWSVGDGLAASATDADGVRSSFVSRDGREWVRVGFPADGETNRWFFEPRALANDTVVGLTLSSSDALAAFVEEHTTAEDVEGACFIGSRAVLSCDESTEWPFTEATIDSPAGSEAVFSCLNLLSVLGPRFSLTTVSLGDAPLDGLDQRIYIGADLPLSLSGGRMAGIDTLNFFGDTTACDGLASIEQVDPARFYVFEPLEQTVQRAELHPALNPESTELIGEIAVGTSSYFLFLYAFDLWALELASGQWSIIDDIATAPQYVLSESGQRGYFFDQNDLHILDFVTDDDAEIGFAVVETVIYVDVPTMTPAPSSIRHASDDQVIFNSLGSTWLVNIPNEVGCGGQYAEALAGNGLVDDC